MEGVHVQELAIAFLIRKANHFPLHSVRVLDEIGHFLELNGQRTRRFVGILAMDVFECFEPGIELGEFIRSSNGLNLFGTLAILIDIGFDQLLGCCLATL